MRDSKGTTMRGDDRRPEELVLRRLDGEFRGLLPADEVRDVARGAADDLDGQIARAALGEMLYRLAHVRLSDTVRT